MHPLKDLDATIGRQAPRRRRRSVGLALTTAMILVLVLVAFYTFMDVGAIPSPRFYAMGGFGVLLMAAVIASLVWLGVSVFELGRFGRPQRGQDILARWTLTPDQLRQRVEQRRRLDAEPGALQTTPLLSVLDSNEDVTVIVCRDAVYVGDLFWQPMDSEPGAVVGRLDGDWLELEWLTQDSSDGYALRVPIAPGSETDAIRAIATFAYWFNAAGK